MDLYLGPRRKQRGWGALLIIAIILLAGLVIAWQDGWLPGEAQSRLSQTVGTEVVTTPTQTLEVRATSPTPPPTQPAAAPLLSSVSPPITPTQIASPHSEAYTADLYRETTSNETASWPNAGGRTKIQTYRVQEGDTLWGIAAQFDLDVDTLRWSNPDLERNPDVLPLDAELVILPVQGVYHRVVEGDTLESIAAQYGVTETDISQYPPNALYPPYTLKPGQGIIVPYGRKVALENIPKPALSPDSPLAWPLVGPITQGFKPDHLAIDIGGPYGATVYAAGDGTITYAKWAATGYGYTVIIDHGEGLETWYSHLKGALIQSGAVARGDAIGEVGSTGNSTGPHVHFEVRLNGQRVNPLDYLPATSQ